MGRQALRAKTLSVALAFLAWMGARPDPAAALSWQFIGPEPIVGAQGNYGGVLIGPTFNAAGRVTAIAPDPTTQGRIFVGTANGGLWMITGANGSNPSFTPISAAFPNPNQAIGAIALDPSTSPPTIYVGTGAGNNCLDCYYGRGLFTSTNLGGDWYETFASVTSFEDQAFTKLMLVNTGNGTQYLFAGIRQGASVNRAGVPYLQGSSSFGGLWQITLGANPSAIQYNKTTPQFT